MAINMPIQGTAADIVKIAMIRLDERLREGGFRARLLLQVHDELLLEAPEDEVDRLVPVLRETMEGALPLVGAADRRREGRPVVGGHDARLATGCRARGGRRAAAGAARRRRGRQLIVIEPTATQREGCPGR